MIRTLRRNHIIYICAFIALLPVILLRDYTPSNELRYLSIADEALRNHTFFTFYNHGEVYADKPPLYFWWLMLCKWIFGEYRMWILSLLSLLPALGILRVMDGWIREETDWEHRHIAALMLITSGLFLGTSVFLRMDMLMTFFVVLALREFWRMATDEKNALRNMWLFPLYLFLALFTKGPLGLLIPLCSTAAYLLASKRIKEFGHFWGWRTWGVLAALCAMWFIGIYAEGGKAYLDNLLVHQTVGRAVNSFHHKAPFYYYLLHIWYCAAPWSLLAVGVFAVSMRPKFIRSDLQRFFQLTFLSTFVLLSFISAKLQVYILPAMPFLIYTAAMFLSRLSDTMWLRLSVAIPAVALAASLPLLLFAFPQEEIFSWGGGLLYAAATILTIRGLSAIWHLFAKGERLSVESVVRHLAIGLLLAVFVGGWAMPSINAKTSYGDVCRKAVEVSERCGVTDFRTWDLPRTESMDVYLGHTVKVMPQDTMPNKQPGKTYILITQAENLKRLPRLGDVTIKGKYAIIIVNDKK